MTGSDGDDRLTTDLARLRAEQREHRAALETETDEQERRRRTNRLRAINSTVAGLERQRRADASTAMERPDGLVVYVEPDDDHPDREDPRAAAVAPVSAATRAEPDRTEAGRRGAWRFAPVALTLLAAFGAAAVVTLALLASGRSAPEADDGNGDPSPTPGRPAAAQPDGETADETAEPTTLEAPTTSTPATNQPAVPPRRIALIAPSPTDDMAFSQSMFDAIDAVADERGDVEVTLFENVGSRSAAAEAIRRAAVDGHDLVIVHSSAFLDEAMGVAADHPDVVFAVGTVAERAGPTNVYTYTAAAEQGGYVLGAMAALETTTGVVGAVGPTEVGVSRRYIEAYRAGAVATRPDVAVVVTYTGSFSDADAAAATTARHIERGADVITGQGHALGEAVAVAADADVAWLGNHVDNAPLGPSTVMASQVYHWEMALLPILADIDGDTVDGRNITLDLANDGLAIEYNRPVPIDDTTRSHIDGLVAAIVDGRVDPTVG